MLKNRYSPLVVFALLCTVLLLAACTRSATTETVPPTSAEGIGGGGEGPAGDTAATQTAIANMQAILIAGQTQTAQAVLGGAGGGGELLTTNTPTAPAVVLPTNTPVSQASTTPVSTGPRQYTVKPGDWLYKIARENGVTPEALMAANPGINPDAVLKPGAVLTIPAPGTGGGEGGKTYVVRHGDNLFRIALNNGTTYQKLAELNGIPAPYTVYPGQVLKLP